MTITPQPRYLFALSAWTNTASTAINMTKTTSGKTYQARYSPSSRSLTPRASWTMIAASTEISSVATITPATASTLGMR